MSFTMEMVNQGSLYSTLVEIHQVNSDYISTNQQANFESTMAGNFLGICLDVLLRLHSVLVADIQNSDLHFYSSIFVQSHRLFVL
mmetsp:Transcript_26677/g.35058  ORF Transcript_26677/g.35058 Transcript_26677/m.35058 type:complete len:85 (-) Transcript_26677:508-762(-)